MKHTAIYVALLAASLSACTTTGTGGGQLSGAGGQPAQSVAFSWTSNDGGISGTMTAQMPDATYQGRFFQITRETRVETLTPLWGRWPYGWSDWRYGGPGLGDSFVTHYSGRVVATLESGSQYMRCRFQLSQPSRGMAGGGEGECQLNGGSTVHATFAPH